MQIFWKFRAKSRGYMYYVLDTLWNVLNLVLHVWLLCDRMRSCKLTFCYKYIRTWASTLLTRSTAFCGVLLDWQRTRYKGLFNSISLSLSQIIKLILDILIPEVGKLSQYLIPSIKGFPNVRLWRIFRSINLATS